MKTKLTIMSLTLAALAAFAGEGVARAETDPRDYSALLALPSQTALVLAYYRHVSTSDSASYSQDVTLLRTAYTLKWESEQ